nr:pentapeptide repeat-containing protein [Pseudomonas flavescens]
MRGSDLSESLLMYSDFTETDFSLASLKNSNVEGGDFRGAELSGADFSVSGLDQCKLHGALYDSKTIWPKNFNPDEHGLLKKKT